MLLRFDRICALACQRKFCYGPYQMFMPAAFGLRAEGSPPLIYGFSENPLNKSLTTCIAS